MKAKYKQKIGEYTIVMFIADAPVDPEATKSKIEAMITPEMTEADVEQLYMANLVYAKTGPEAELIEDGVADHIRQKLNAKGENRLLLDSGEYIADYRGTEYWIKKSGRWKQEKIEEIGIALPAHAVLQADMTAEQQAEIAAQNEAERIAGLAAEKKAEEKKAKLHALAREALMKADEAELLGEAFDKLAWLNPKKAEIEMLYA
jgi:hypothetical protein